MPVHTHLVSQFYYNQEISMYIFEDLLIIYLLERVIEGGDREGERSSLCRSTPPNYSNSGAKSDLSQVSHMSARTRVPQPPSSAYRGHWLEAAAEAEKLGRR